MPLQVLFALGDSNHPLKISEKGKDSLMLFATDTRCSYANIVARKELFDRGVKTVEALADEKLVGRKAVIAATAIGSGTHVYGVYVLKSTRAGDGKPVNDHVAPVVVPVQVYGTPLIQSVFGLASFATRMSCQPSPSKSAQRTPRPGPGSRARPDLTVVSSNLGKDVLPRL